MWPFSGGERNIDRSSASAPSAGVEVQEGAAGIDKCPVDHETRSAWLAQNGKGASSGGESKGTTSALAFLSASGGPSVQGTVTVDRGGSSSTSSKLSVERVVSSIPRFGASDRRTESLDQGGHASETSTADPSTSPNWVYPSPAQFFSAMTRKNHNPQAEDMDIVVPIHNAVNERAWQQILEWERMADAQSWKTCGGPQLVSFKGRPKDLTWRAWVRSLMGYQRPFDRHDWEVDRCGRRVKYVIDFYTGRTDDGSSSSTSLSFYLDTRPSPADWEGIRMRFVRFWSKP